MIALAIWVASVAIRIETQNAAAGYYLPRRDQEPGKWRISPDGTPRDKLRGLVSTAGLFQYFLAPIVVGLGVIHAMCRSAAWRRWLAVGSAVVGAVALWLALYRSYFSSLGW